MTAHPVEQPLSLLSVSQETPFDLSDGVTMRIGEIAIVGPSQKAKTEFIKTACKEILVDSEELIYGSVKVNDQLVLHLYGLDGPDQETNPFWDLVSQKLLGYVILFDWDDPNGFPLVRETIDSITGRYRIPLVVAANIAHLPSSIPASFINTDLNLAEQSQFTFCNISESQSVNNVLVTLIDSLIEKLNT